MVAKYAKKIIPRSKKVGVYEMVWNQSSQQERTVSWELADLLLHGKRRFWMVINKLVGFGAGLG
eukprot:scaffold47768_cov44-Cyclotella_meneghiniana.AAC.1